MRQEFIHNSIILNYHQVQKLLQGQVDYKALPAKVSQQVLMILDKNWKSFWESLKAFHSEPEKFFGRPKLPKYKHKLEGRNILVYTIQAISKTALVKRGVVKLSQTNIELKTAVPYEQLAQVRVVPKLNHYVVEVVYNTEIQAEGLDESRVAGLDLGVTNLATITSNIKGFSPFIVNGKPLKAINQFFNKKKSELQSISRKERQKESRSLARNATLRLMIIYIKLVDS
nr:transposase [Hassalia byssoidea]